MNQACDNCQTLLTNWDYRYWGKHFCRTCYDQLLKLHECTICHKRKMIFHELKVPVCKKCQLIGLPCIRCNKIEYTPGKVTEDGPVCNSCSKYFREPKKCEVCHKKTLDTSNRNMENGEVKKICTNCYRKTLPICSKCHKQRKAFSFSLERQPVCKICSTEDVRVCTQCNNKFSAGMGRICRGCSYNNTLDRKVTFSQDSLSAYMSKYLVKFSSWLIDRRGVEFTAINIDKYFPYFLELDQLSQSLGKIPSYKDIVNTFSVAKTRKNLLVTLFFEDIDLIKVDLKIKEEYANLDMIERYLEYFEDDTLFHEIITSYSNQLFEKLKRNKTTIRSIRLALTPTFKFLLYSTNFEDIYPTQDAFNGYLWCYPGQRSAITGFINFLKTKYKIDLDIEVIQDTVLLRPRESHQYLKQRFIDNMRKFESMGSDKETLMKNAIEYLHDIKISKNIYLSIDMVKRNKQKESYLHVANQKFFIPIEVEEKLL